MIILLDLDGTLTNTANVSFKPMKDGKEETNLSRIPIFDGAREFVNTLKSKVKIQTKNEKLLITI